MKKNRIIAAALAIFLLAASAVIADKWSDYADMSSGTIADADTFLVRDVSDTSLAATGTQKEYPWSVMLTDLAGASQTFTNKTLDANGTGNTIKQYSYLIISGRAMHMRGAGVSAPSTTQTDFNFGLPKFADDVDEATNWIDIHLQVPPDLDTAVDLTATLTFYLGGADTADHDYVLSMCNPAASAAAACTPSNAVNLAYTADGSGADGDVEQTAETTLTDWKSNLTAGRFLRLRLARDGDDGTNDASTVDSYPLVLTIKYGSTN